MPSDVAESAHRTTVVLGHLLDLDLDIGIDLDVVEHDHHDMRPTSSRRPSASGGQLNTYYANRVHKTSDSYHITPGPPASNVGHGQPSTVSLNNPGSPQQKVVHVLVQRLKSKVRGTTTTTLNDPDVFQLPCNSGQSLDKLESDPLTQQAIETLVELSHNSLDIIAWALSELADRLAKVYQSSMYWGTLNSHRASKPIRLLDTPR